MHADNGPDRSIRPRTHLIERELTGKIIGAFYEVYNALGYGFLESTYARGLALALARRSVHAEREYPAQVHLWGQIVGFHRIDMLVERRVIVEIKASEVLPQFAERQLRNYLAALRLEVGLILHFGPRAEFHRMVHRPDPNVHPGSSG